jgi:ABC-type lipoprotein export system ATPase subunit
MTIVLVTHESDIAAYASRVLVMKDGQVRSDQRREPVAARAEAEPHPLEAGP